MAERVRRIYRYLGRALGLLPPPIPPTLRGRYGSVDGIPMDSAEIQHRHVMHRARGNVRLSQGRYMTIGESEDRIKRFRQRNKNN